MIWLITTWIAGLLFGALCLWFNMQRRKNNEPQSMPMWGGVIIAGFMILAPGAFAPIFRGFMQGLFQMPGHLSFASNLEWSFFNPTYIFMFVVSFILVGIVLYRLHRAAKKEGKSIYDYVSQYAPSEEQLKNAENDYAQKGKLRDQRDQ